MFRRDVLENMIQAVEANYSDRAANLRDDIALTSEESRNGSDRAAALRPYYEKEQQLISERLQARTQLFTAICSLCQATVQTICRHYEVNVTPTDPHNPYLPYDRDLIKALGVTAKWDYQTPELQECYALRSAVGALSSPDCPAHVVKRAIKRLADCGITDVITYCDNIAFASARPLMQTIGICHSLLVKCEAGAALNINTI